MSKVSVKGIEESSEELTNISLNLEDKFLELTKDINLLKESLEILSSYNGQDATEIIEEQKGGFINNLLKEKTTYKYIWQITIPSITEISSTKILEFGENIDLLKENQSELEQLSITLKEFIHEIELQLGIEKKTDIVTFFNKLKGNPTWEELKKINKEANDKKQLDELYNIFHTKNQTVDVVDIALDEMGTSYLTTTLSTKYAHWYLEKHPDSGATPGDDWCAEYVSYVMDKSGNDKAVNPFLNVVQGAEDAKILSSMGKGTWHSSSDKDYNPKRGDIFYTYEGKHQHTGIILGSSKDVIYTVEGNTASDEGKYYVSPTTNTGGCVNTRIRPKTYVEGGYYTPEYINNKINTETKAIIPLTDHAKNIKLEIDQKYEEHRQKSGHGSRAGMG